MTRAARAALAAAVVLAPACGRHVVLTPEVVQKNNDAGWRIRRTEPGRRVTEATQPESRVEQVVVASADGTADGTAPNTATHEPVTPVPGATQSTSPPRLAADTLSVSPEALRSPRDAYGIPRDLYAIDPMLRGYVEVMNARVGARRTVGAWELVGTALSIVASVGLCGLAREHDSQAAIAREGGFPYDNPASQEYVLCAVTAGFGLALFTAGLADLTSPGDPSALRRYYNETYEKQ